MQVTLIRADKNELGYNPRVYSSRFEQALTFAALRHQGQKRRGTGAPYLTHLVHVARILQLTHQTEATQCAGLMHDVLEDTCQSKEERIRVAETIQNEFGTEIAEAVVSLSEPKWDENGNKYPWRYRKDSYLAQLREASSIALAVSAADKIHNLCTLCEDLEGKDPGEVWKKFTGGPKQSHWFYASVVKYLETRLRSPELLEALQQAFARFEQILLSAD